MSENGPRVISRLSWLTGRSGTQVPDELEPLMRALGTKSIDKSRIIHAYNVAAKCHEGQFRRSGEPYITHPVAVATILAELGMDEDSLVGALLHDTVEDTDYTLEQVRAEFGPTVELLVDGVTKLDKVEYGEAAQAETVRKMVIAMAKDIRVLLIKLADRLHNARTWKYMPADKARAKARETLEIYAPLAHRLGMNSIKWELEDLSFKTMYPEVYSEIEKLVQERTPEREAYIARIEDQLSKALKNQHIRCTITGRPKHYYSIYQKMILRGKDFDDIYDLVGVRVLVDTIPDCYAVLGVANTLYTPLQGRIKDYIATPKFNLYQSIHTTVIGPEDRTLEIQIRTYDMHRRAEYGVAAHWRYKENAGKSAKQQEAQDVATDQQTQLTWLRQLVDWQRETADPAEFLESLSYEISGNKVYVFTPAGEVMELAAGATPVDFAYAVHTEVGHRTVGARVNDRLVTLDHKLESGDTVEIITSKNPEAGPSRGWMEFVATPRARAKIRVWFRKSARDESLENGKDRLARAIRKRNQPVQRLMTHESLSDVARQLGRKSVDDLYVAVGEGAVSAETVVRELINMQGGEAGVEETLAEGVTPTQIARPASRGAESAIRVRGIDSGDVMVKLAKCCTPLPNDKIVGFVTRGNGLSVHRADCPNVAQLQREPDRFIDVAWSDDSEAVFVVQIQVDALDRQGLLSDISRVLLDNGVNLLGGNMTTTKERMSRSVFSFEMADTHHLRRILADLRSIEGVYDAYRITPAKKSSKRRVPEQ
ncbi:GTP pyrophosphokinase [Actinobaculum suis]|uniref:Bifunctional (P)ppGpp synthetase/guanosine-3',5'-bis(Diphosphate) 3'-pyrophosphohydrolase n=1 Tax=Actinobaculum suis TaxID=1657 RepID=A0A1G7BKR5_9ACTO|nr:bifunctional (p)ppGpp synthetase/guanosine-3',5'-bis(diphosphate) 3'-pyrophosphohydrolase [Actinobaculum suis]MDY5153736.1 bifunctional (p)ppGpp synthetase/guanosine-3',5'-bis(diphosphate) 3'-pyrophosphohydrolase [Actinobaculum suis]SDE27036.1 GTP pyrophosphokinase [Actinobaculum suis]